MKTIHKYKLLSVHSSTILMPEGAEILAIQIQFNEVCMWVMVDLNNVVTQRCIETYGTGHELPDDMKGHKYISTVQQNGFVWHFFERLI